MAPLIKSRQTQLDKTKMNAEHEKFTQVPLRDLSVMRRSHNYHLRSCNPSSNPPEQTAPFLTKLPLELRQAIYNALFGNNLVHLWHQEDYGHNKIEHRLCVYPEVCGRGSLRGLCEMEVHPDCKAKANKGYF